MNAPRVVVILGSVTPPGRMHRALLAAVEVARTSGVEPALIDLANVPMEFADGRPLGELGGELQHAASVVLDAQGVILASPVYRGTLTGALKNFLDLLPLEALHRKPVGIVAMGATTHHFLGTASHLRDICAWFGALVTPTDVYLTSAQFVDGRIDDTALADLSALFQAVASLSECTKNSAMGPVPLAGRGG